MATLSLLFLYQFEAVNIRNKKIVEQDEKEMEIPFNPGSDG
jgi:hypothetical protein